MKNLELEGFGLVEMNHDEMVEVEGGSWLGVLIGACVGYIIGVFTSTPEGVTTEQKNWAFTIAGAVVGNAII